jgi:hypothetical protein
MHSCNLSTWKAEAGRLQVQGERGMHIMFKTSLGYSERPYLKKKFYFK